MRYLVTTPAPAYRLDGSRFAVESAFAQHLRELKGLLGPRFTELILPMPQMDQAAYLKLESGMSVIDESADGIRFVGMYPHDCSKAQFLRDLPKIISAVNDLVKRSDVLHVDFSYDLFRPLGALFCVIGRLRGKHILAIDDIDRRRDAQMRLRMGVWSRSTYLICRYVYDPIRELLYRAYVRMADLMLFKELGQVRDFGRGAAHVRLILDPNFSAEQVVDDAFVQKKTRALADVNRPLKVMYFGRLVPYKGVDKMIEAVALAHRRGANLTLDIMGSGEQRESLVELAQSLGVGHLLTWLKPVPYGEAFFDVLKQRDILMACPLSGDTPRSAWDALASGMPLLAFDTDFYKSMADYSHAVDLTPWPDVEPMAARLVELAHDKSQLSVSIAQAVKTARSNTSEIWMRRRNQWVADLCAGAGDAQHVIPAN